MSGSNTSVVIRSVGRGRHYWNMLGCLYPEGKVVETQTPRSLPVLDVSGAMECKSGRAMVTAIKMREVSKFSAAVEKR